ncbi:MAG: DUF1311 domain-containing protein [Chitinophagaceae bacterium]|nr:DUF1311 domain-containing protein [Chitinophagaceae bacterium]
MQKMKIILLFALCCGLRAGFAQTHKTVDSLRATEQSCLDSGRHMTRCTYNYLRQMDSLLNLVYAQYSGLLTPAEQRALKAEQLKWLKKRDQYFKQVDKAYNDSLRNGSWGRDMRMISFDDMAAFVADSVKKLIDRRNQSKKR